MEFEKPMNKDIVEFSFEPKYSPLKREKLSNEIKSFTQFPLIQKQLQKESKIDILNYLIDSLSATTNSITSYYLHHPKDSINLILNRFHEKKQENSIQPLLYHDYSYSEIPASTKIKALSLIEENSDIRKDNYSIMFDNIKLTLHELLNPKKKSDKNQRKSDYNAVSSASSAQKTKPNDISLNRKDLRNYSKSFSINLNDNDEDDNKATLQYRPKIKKKTMIANRKEPSTSVVELPEEFEDTNDNLIQKRLNHDHIRKKKKNKKMSQVISKENSQCLKYGSGINKNLNKSIGENNNNSKRKHYMSSIISLKKTNHKNDTFPNCRDFINNTQFKYSVVKDKSTIQSEENDVLLPDFINKFHVTLKEKTAVVSSSLSSPKKR